MSWQLIFNLALLGFVQAQLPNVHATFSDDIEPFHIDVDDHFLDWTRSRVHSARKPDNIEAFPFDDGPAALNWTSVQDEWLNNYVWGDVQAQINEDLHQFTTIVTSTNSSYSGLVPLHFVHHRSPRADAIPLLFVHGWPGSFLEVAEIIDLLTSPPNSSIPAFHVVAPSIPGFGFSPAPTKPGFGPVAAADAFNTLMHQLNYDQYVGQAGDLGAVILRALSVSHPHNLVSLLLNFWPVQPTASDLARFAENETTADETSYIRTVQNFQFRYAGYLAVQITGPLIPAYATGDSPLGLTMWIFSVMRVSVDYLVFSFSPRQLITWTYMYLIQGPYGTFRFYKEMVADNFVSGGGYGMGPGYVTTPTAISEFPFDVWYRMPLDWAQREGNVKRRYLHERGGHYPSLEVPRLLLEDIWNWFGDREVSGTAVFHRRDHLQANDPDQVVVGSIHEEL